MEESFSGFSKALPENPNHLYEPIRYTLSVGGKRMRPLLTLMGAGLFREDVTCAVRAAVGIELFHNFTLLHDDIMDNAPLRRGKPSVYAKWNSNIAILSGDAMYSEAFRQLALSPKEVLPEVLEIFTKTALQVCEGQQLDMDFEKLSNVSIADYLNMIELKTAVLLGASLEIGAICAGVNKEEAQKLFEFGKHVGLAFQLQDDILDVYGDSEKFGKKVGGDIVANKKTYLLLKTFELANKVQKEQLKNLALLSGNRSHEKIDDVKRIYDELAIKQFAQVEMQQQYQIGIAFLESVQADSSKKTVLKNFTDALMLRDF